MECPESRTSDDHGGPSRDILARLDESILEIQANSNKNEAQRVCQFSDATFGEWEELRKANRHTVGFETGLPGLDSKTTGIRRKDFWIIGGRPGNGKTALALEMIQANCCEEVPVGFFSLEMPKERILHRLWSSMGRIDFNLIRVPSSGTEADGMRIRRSMAEVGTWPLFVDDSADLSISEIVARARLMIKRHDVGLIIVDYLQIVDAGGRDERSRLTKISKALRMLAKKENVAVVGLSQLARPNVKDLNKRPQIWDLKESGTLEADADTVLLLYRPVDEEDQFIGTDEIIIGKQRSGETGFEPVTYLGKHMRWEERE
jgi:replicative DNA helicase